MESETPEKAVEDRIHENLFSSGKREVIFDAGQYPYNVQLNLANYSDAFAIVIPASVFVKNSEGWSDFEKGLDDYNPMAHIIGLEFIAEALTNSKRIGTKPDSGNKASFMFGTGMANPRPKFLILAERLVKKLYAAPKEVAVDDDGLEELHTPEDVRKFLSKGELMRDENFVGVRFFFFAQDPLYKFADAFKLQMKINRSIRADYIDDSDEDDSDMEDQVAPPAGGRGNRRNAQAQDSDDDILDSDDEELGGGFGKRKKKKIARRHQKQKKALYGRKTGDAKEHAQKKRLSPSQSPEYQFLQVTSTERLNQFLFKLQLGDTSVMSNSVLADPNYDIADEMSQVKLSALTPAKIIQLSARYGCDSRQSDPDNYYLSNGGAPAAPAPVEDAEADPEEDEEDSIETENAELIAARRRALLAAAPADAVDGRRNAPMLGAAPPTGGTGTQRLFSFPCPYLVWNYHPIKFSAKELMGTYFPWYIHSREYLEQKLLSAVLRCHKLGITNPQRVIAIENKILADHNDPRYGQQETTERFMRAQQDLRPDGGSAEQRTTAQSQSEDPTSIVADTFIELEVAIKNIFSRQNAQAHASWAFGRDASPEQIAWAEGELTRQHNEHLHRMRELAIKHQYKVLTPDDDRHPDSVLAMLEHRRKNNIRSLCNDTNMVSLNIDPANNHIINFLLEMETLEISSTHNYIRDTSVAFFSCYLYRKRTGIDLKNNIMFHGAPGTGKCFARGTLLMAYSPGEVSPFAIPVEKVTAETRLIGDDLLPRTPDAFVRGVEDGYQIVSTDLLVPTNYRVTGEHVLCLKVPRPTIKLLFQSMHLSPYAYAVTEWVIDPELNVPLIKTSNISTEIAGGPSEEGELAKIRRRWEDTVWEVTVRKYLEFTKTPDYEALLASNNGKSPFTQWQVEVNSTPVFGNPEHTYDLLVAHLHELGLPDCCPGAMPGFDNSALLGTALLAGFYWRTEPRCPFDLAETAFREDVHETIVSWIEMYEAYTTSEHSKKKGRRSKRIRDKHGGALAPLTSLRARLEALPDFMAVIDKLSFCQEGLLRDRVIQEALIPHGLYICGERVRRAYTVGMLAPDLGHLEDSVAAYLESHASLTIRAWLPSYCENYPFISRIKRFLGAGQCQIRFQYDSLPYQHSPESPVVCPKIEFSEVYVIDWNREDNTAVHFSWESGRIFKTYTFEVRPCGSFAYYGFSVKEESSRRFLLADGTVTHNSNIVNTAMNLLIEDSVDSVTARSSKSMINPKSRNFTPEVFDESAAIFDLPDHKLSAQEKSTKRIEQSGMTKQVIQYQATVIDKMNGNRHVQRIKTPYEHVKVACTNEPQKRDGDAMQDRWNHIDLQIVFRYGKSIIDFKTALQSSKAEVHRASIKLRHERQQLLMFFAGVANKLCALPRINIDVARVRLTQTIEFLKKNAPNAMFRIRALEMMTSELCVDTMLSAIEMTFASELSPFRYLSTNEAYIEAAKKADRYDDGDTANYRICMSDFSFEHLLALGPQLVCRDDAAIRCITGRIYNLLQPVKYSIIHHIAKEFGYLDIEQIFAHFDDPSELGYVAAKKRYADMDAKIAEHGGTLPDEYKENRKTASEIAKQTISDAMDAASGMGPPTTKRGKGRGAAVNSRSILAAVEESRQTSALNVAANSYQGMRSRKFGADNGIDKSDGSESELASDFKPGHVYGWTKSMHGHGGRRKRKSTPGDALDKANDGEDEHYSRNMFVPNTYLDFKSTNQRSRLIPRFNRLDVPDENLVTYSSTYLRLNCSLKDLYQRGHDLCRKHSIDYETYKSLIDMLVKTTVRLRHAPNIPAGLENDRDYIKYRLASKLDMEYEYTKSLSGDAMLVDEDCTYLAIDLLLENPMRIVEQLVHSFEYEHTTPHDVMIGVADLNNPFCLRTVRMEPNPGKNISIRNVNYYSKEVEQALYNGLKSMTTGGFHDRLLNKPVITIEEDLEAWVLRRHFVDEGYDIAHIEKFLPQNERRMLMAIYGTLIAHQHTHDIGDTDLVPLDAEEARNYMRMAYNRYRYQSELARVDLPDLKRDGKEAVKLHRVGYVNMIRILNRLRIEHTRPLLQYPRDLISAFSKKYKERSQVYKENAKAEEQPRKKLKAPPSPGPQEPPPDYPEEEDESSSSSSAADYSTIGGASGRGAGARKGKWTKKAFGF